MTPHLSDTGNRRAAPAGSLILVVNDHEWTARSLQTILESEGYRVGLAFTGRQALERAATSPPDLVLLDVQLPDISGPEVCRLLRSLPEVGRGTPVILTTAGGVSRQLREAVASSGAWDFQTQPFDGPRLLSKVRTFLEARTELRRIAPAESQSASPRVYRPPALWGRVRELAADARRRGEPVGCLLFTVSPNGTGISSSEAERLELAIGESVRLPDVVGRFSPGSCVVLAPRLGRAASPDVLRRVRSALGETGIEPNEVRMGFAMLGTTPESAHADSPEALLHDAITGAEPILI